MLSRILYWTGRLLECGHRSQGSVSTKPSTIHLRHSGTVYYCLTFGREEMAKPSRMLGTSTARVRRDVNYPLKRADDACNHKYTWRDFSTYLSYRVCSWFWCCYCSFYVQRAAHKHNLFTDTRTFVNEVFISGHSSSKPNFMIFNSKRK